MCKSNQSSDSKWTPSPLLASWCKKYVPPSLKRNLHQTSTTSSLLPREQSIKISDRNRMYFPFPLVYLFGNMVWFFLLSALFGFGCLVENFGVEQVFRNQTLSLRVPALGWVSGAKHSPNPNVQMFRTYKETLKLHWRIPCPLNNPNVGETVYRGQCKSFA